MHEFHIFSSHYQWNLPFLLGESWEVLETDCCSTEPTYYLIIIDYETPQESGDELRV